MKARISPAVRLALDLGWSTNPTSDLIHELVDKLGYKEAKARAVYDELVTRWIRQEWNEPAAGREARARWVCIDPEMEAIL